MPKLKLSLSIGFPTATHHDEIEIDDEDWSACENDEEREELITEISTEWAWNYISIGAYVVDEGGER